MADWEDASNDEQMARFDAAMERLSIDASVEAALYFGQLLDESPAFTWPPPPNTAHASLERQASGVRELIAAGRHHVFLPAPPKSLAKLLPLPMDPVELAPMPSPICLVVQKAFGQAPYVGDPFVWVWKVAADESGRWVSTDSWPVHRPVEPWEAR